MRRVRAVTICLLAALALSGCMRTTAPVALAQPGDLDSIAYGQPYDAAPSVVADSGGAIGAFRASFAAASQRAYAPAPVAYAAAPMPVAPHATYRLDAGDKLRVVVYGQEGL